MAQAMYVAPDGTLGKPRGFGAPKRASSIGHWLKAAKKALARDLEAAGVVFDLGKYDAEVTGIIFYGKGGSKIIVDRRANSIGR